MFDELTQQVKTLQYDLGLVRASCHEWRGQATMLESEKSTLNTSMKEHSVREELLSAALVVLQQLEETWRGCYEVALAALGSQGLNAVFPDGTYEVLLESSIKRGASNLDIVLVKNGKRVRLKGGSGGSVVQVLAYLLRHLITTSQRPGLRLLEALDEPFSMVAAEQRPALSTLVKEITQRLGFQLLFSSHEDELLDAADTAYLVHPGGRVEQLKSKEENRA